MPNPRLKTAFNGMEAPRLRELLNKLCECGRLTIEDQTGKIEVDGRKIIILNGFIDLTESDDSDGEGQQDHNGGIASYNDKEGDQDNNGGVGSYNDNEDELAKKKGNDGEVSIIDNATLPELETAETNQQMGTTGEQKTDKDDKEAFENKEGCSEEESETDSWDNSDDDNDVPALRKCEIKELLLSKKDYLKEIERELDDNYREDYHWPNYGEPWKSVDDPDYADRFIWSCCEGHSNAEECISTRHKALEEGSSKRIRAEA
ncbi:hypothetical protein ABEW05_008578 [Botrytis cinerea]